MALSPVADGENLFADRIRRGEIRNEGELKSLYRSAAKKLHPDGGGDPGDDNAFIRLTAQYKEALCCFSVRKDRAEHGTMPPFENRDPRKDFFTCWFEWENLDLPFNRTKSNRQRKERLAALMARAFLEWRPDRGGLYKSAFGELALIKGEKPPNDLAHLRQPLLADRLRPFSYDLARYELTGRPLYKLQIDRLAPDILGQVKKRGYASLYAFLRELVAGLE